MLMDGVRWGVEPIDDVRALAELVGMHPTELVRFTDVRAFERTARAEPLRNYRYRWLAKSNGGTRLIEAPKPILRHLQRVVTRTIVAKIPTHDAAHGFVAGRSTATCAAPHVGADVVLRVDLESFFSTVPIGRVFRTLRSAGYADEVAHRITGLATNSVPAAVLQAAPKPAPQRRPAHRRAIARLRHPHLPQGAPTSPSLANLAALGLDRRLSGLAASFDSTYTRYADDLAFSGDMSLRRRSDRFLAIVHEIVVDEGFVVNGAKTRVASAGQQQRVAGMIVNERVNVDRRSFDLLRAELHDAATNGVVAANRSEQWDYRSHLRGRIAWVASVNPAKARRLSDVFEQIDFG